MSERVLVTGASGMLGANLCRRLVEEGMDVVALVRRPLTHPLLGGLPIRQVLGDLSDRDSLKTALEGCDIVFHVAGSVSYLDRDKSKLFDTNFQGTHNLLEAAARASIRRVVHTSSTAAIGIGKDTKPLDEESSFHPRYRKVPYMESKRSAEVLALHAPKLDVVVVNPATIYGAGDIYLNTGMLFRQLKRGKIRFVPPGGTAVVSVRDCVEGHILALRSGIPGRRYILSSGNHSYGELWQGIAKALGVRAPTRTIPSPLFALAYGAGVFHDTVLPRALRNPVFSRHLTTIAFRNRYFDATRARQELGWTPTQDLQEMLNEAARFYLQHGLL